MSTSNSSVPSTLGSERMIIWRARRIAFTVSSVTFFAIVMAGLVVGMNVTLGTWPSLELLSELLPEMLLYSASGAIAVGLISMLVPRPVGP